MSTLRLVLGDQLTPSLSALHGLDATRDVVLMVEVHDETTYVRHHKQKLILVLSAMRHFAKTLTDDGITVDYVRLEDDGNTGSFTGEVERALKRHDADRLVVTAPSEWRVWEMMQSWSDAFGVPVEIRDDDRFLCSRAAFEDWAEGRERFLMEHFYRMMRRTTGWLMDGDDPEGGTWNYDAENRNALPDNVSVPAPRRFEPDATTQNVIALVERRFADHFGEARPFGWAVTRTQALEALDYFVAHLLPRFGDYQDAMKQGEPFLFHATLSPYLNLGLLVPQEVCEAVLAAYADGNAPLPATEGFIRQILGWREYVRGIYWLRMPDYAKTNFFEAERPLPSFYWTGETDLHCLHEAITATRRHAYAHHIQRLMVTGNFALLTGLSPAAVNAWYLTVYADAFEWVELPNTHGMALHADGGLLGSKPYAASGAYINRMSDYCSRCTYSPHVKQGPEACPFNYLYWYFLIVNEEKLSSNHRMAMMYRTLERMGAERREEIIHDAERFLDQLD